MRTESSIINLICAFIGQFLGLLISLAARFIFVKILATEYLGLSGLFSNILTVLSFAELGIGAAINYSLYKPLAEKDTEQIKSLMRLYKFAYRTIGIIIFVGGLIILPFLPVLINDMPTNIPYINLIFILFVINSASSYFYSYKRALIISDQKRYIATIYRYSFYFLLNVAQIIVLLLTRNYILYLLTQIAITLLENVAISIKANKLYPYLREGNIEKLNSDTEKEIKRNVSATIIHSIGGKIINATDNIVISKYISNGLIQVGLYSNYFLVTNALNIILAQVFSSMTASIGNLAVEEDKNKLHSIFKKVFFLNFWVFSFSTICLLILFNDFIELWLGSKFVFNSAIVLTIVINFYLTGMRKTVITFRDALGLYWADRYRPIIEVIINIVVSIILAKYIGIIGVFIGTIVSTLTTCFWVEPYVLYKHGLHQKVRGYFLKYAQYTIVFAIVSLITVAMSSIITTVTIGSFIIKIIICILVPNIIYYLIYRKSDEFKYYINLIKTILQKIKNKNLTIEQ